MTRCFNSGTDYGRIAVCNELQNSYNEVIFICLISMVPNISRKPFRDIKYEEINFDENKSYVIQQVMNYGDRNDFVGLLKYYGKTGIRKEIIFASYLKKDVLNFVCFYFGLSPEDFTCYKHRQSHLEHWNF